MTTPPPAHDDDADVRSAHSSPPPSFVPRHTTAPSRDLRDEGPGYARTAGYAVPGQPGAYGVPPAAVLQLPPPPRRLNGLGTTTVALLGVQAVLAVAATLVSAWGVLSWSQVSAASAEVRLPSDEADLALTLLRAPLAALTGIAFVAWTWIATRNARDAGASVRHAPGWALGGWLVPVLNLWRPKQMVDDLWRASMPGVPAGIDLRLVRTPLTTTCWWAAYLIGTCLPAAAFAEATMAVLGPSLGASAAGVPPSSAVDVARVNESSAMVDLWASVLMVVAAGLAMHFVHRITQWQDERTTASRGRSPHEPDCTR